MYSKILVPIDGSVHSQNALSVACKLSEKDITKIYLVHIPEVIDDKEKLIWNVRFFEAEENSNDLYLAGEGFLKEAKNYAKAKGVKNVETMIKLGKPVSVILEISKQEKVDVIVMGSRGLSDLGGMVAGSVSHKVGHLAQCSVVTVS